MADDPEITDPRDPYRRPDIVVELGRWLVSRASLREATVSHALLEAARDEIVALREAIGIVRDAACEPDNSYFHDNIWQAVQKMLDMVDALKGKAP